MATRKKGIKVLKEKIQLETPENEVETKKTVRRYNPKLLIIPVVIVVAILLYRFKGLIVAATVNGNPISRIAVLQELEKEGGKSVLDSMVTNELIRQEAAKEKVTASPDDVAAQIAQITNNLKAQGQTLDAALAAQGMTRADLDDQIKLQVMVQKMAGKDITVTDKEIQDYFTQNSSSYAKGTKIDTVKDQIKSTLMQQKSSQATQTWIANLKTNAKINYFVSY